MAIIYSYPDNANILLTDLLIGTSTVRIAGKKKNLTKNFTVEALGNFISLNNPTVWGTIVGNLQDQTDLWSALESKQGNITLTTNGVDGPSTFIADVLNIPQYTGGLQSLQQVTDIGNTTTNDIVVTDGAYTTTVALTQFSTSDSIANKFAGLSTMYGLSFQEGIFSATLFNLDSITHDINFYLPVLKAGAAYTLATTDDITAGTLQEVTDAGNTTTNSIILDNTEPYGDYSSINTLGSLYSNYTLNSPTTGLSFNANYGSEGIFLTSIENITTNSIDINDSEMRISYYDGTNYGAIDLNAGVADNLGGSISLSSSEGIGTIRVSALTNNIQLEFPNKAAGTYTIATTDDIPSITPAGLTKTDDTNVTLTLGGTPNTALLEATSLTLGWTGTLADSRIASATTWNAKQEALSGTGFVKSTAGVITYDTSTYTPTSRTLTINGVGYDLSADRSWTISTNAGTVTSVGMTVPSAFSVTPSSITTSGTFAITGAGAASQYVRGDGTLANFPISTGGGASVSYYLNGSVSQGTIGGVAYKEMNGTPIIGAGTDFTINADGYIAQFITDVGDPNKLLIPAGNWNFETYFSASSGGGSPRFYIELYKYDGATFTLITSNSATPENITGGTSIDLYFTAIAVPATTLLATDRLAVRFYVIHSGRTITMHTEDSRLSQIITTFSTGLTTLNGLTSQAQYFAVGTTGTDFNISSATDTHTFNLPTASAINRGALSTTDWTLFNGKQNALNGTGLVKSTAGVISYDTNNYTKIVVKSNAVQSITGTTANTIVAYYLISGGVFSADDFFRIASLQTTHIQGGTPGAWTTRCYLNTSASLSGALSIASTGPTALSSQYNQLSRNLFLSGGTIKGFPFTGSALSDITNSTGALGSGTYNPANDIYFIIAIQLGSATDTAALQSILITN